MRLVCCSGKCHLRKDTTNKNDTIIGEMINPYQKKRATCGGSDCAAALNRISGGAITPNAITINRLCHATVPLHSSCLVGTTYGQQSAI